MYRLMVEFRKYDFIYRSQKGVMQSPSMTMNEEWQAMFGTADDRVSPNRTPDNRYHH